MRTEYNQLALLEQTLNAIQARALLNQSPSVEMALETAKQQHPDALSSLMKLIAHAAN